MGASSVTGVGQGDNTLGVSHLIGPRYSEEVANKNEITRLLVLGLVISQALTFVFIAYLMVR